MAEQIITNRCSGCKQFKPLLEFYKDRSKKNGLRSWCKSCQRDYAQSKKGKAAEKRYRQSEKGKASHRKGNAEFNARHPDIIKAHNAITCAVTAGKLPRPNTRLCHYCPKPAQEYHHWHGYAPEHWLDVVPVCILCHKNLP